METGLQVFENGQFGKVRVLEKEGEPWFVAGDVCEILGLENVSRALDSLDDDEKSVYASITKSKVSNDFNDLRTNSRIVSESGLYALIFKSSKADARKFRKWVTSEVLPSIRKTGKYEAPTVKKTVTPLEDRLAGAKVILETHGLEGNQLVLSLDRIYKNETGQSALEAASIQLISPVQEHLLTPTELGAMLGNISGRAVNKILEAEGMQYREGKLWHLTAKGKSYGEVCDMGKIHNSGQPVTHIKWRRGVLDAIRVDN